jgi:hypothetical protein
MAKKQWQTETQHIDPTFAIAQFGNSAGTGHDHDGADDDGHCPKVNLASHVTGLLPVANLGSRTAWAAISVDVINTYFTTPVNASWLYNVFDDIVTIRIPEMLGAHGSNVALQFEPNSGNWPAEIIPDTPQYVGGVVMKEPGAANDFRHGMLLIPNATSTDIIAAITIETAELQSGGFATAAKGIYRQTICYKR